MMENEKLISLVCSVQNGENDAMTELYDAFYNDIYYYILKTVNNSELASDLTQDAFIEIFQTIGSLKEPVAFVNWSKKIAYHRCTAYFRKKRDLLLDENEEEQSVLDTIVEEREEFIPDEALDKEELKKTIHEMIDSLPEEQRTAIMMRYFDEISVKEIADIQGVTEGTVKSRLNYGRKAIKSSVEEYEKKNGVKLRCAGVVPLLLWLARKKRVEKSMSLIGSTGRVPTSIEKTTGTSVKASGKIMSLFTKKMIVSIVAVIVVGALTTALVAKNKEKNKQNVRPYIEMSEHIDVSGNLNKGENTEAIRVYETTFGDTLIISAAPITEYNGRKADGESLPFPQSEARYPSDEQITKAIIIDELKPVSTQLWFAYLTKLESIEGLEKLDVSNVTDMSSMFFA